MSDKEHDTFDGGIEQNPVANLAVRDDLEAASSYAEEGAFGKTREKVNEALTKLDQVHGPNLATIRVQVGRRCDECGHLVQEGQPTVWTAMHAYQFDTVDESCPRCDGEMQRDIKPLKVKREGSA
jgi:hypothetical protein